MSQLAIFDVTSSNPQIPTSFTTNSGVAIPVANNLNVLGARVAAGSSPVATTGAGATVTVNVQTTQAIAATNASNVGLAAFDSAHFNVDANGFVSLDNPFVGLTITGDTGGAISPSANNWNLGGTFGPAGSGISISGSGSTLAVRMAPNYNLSDFAFQNTAAATTRTLEVNNQDNDAVSSAILRSAVTGTSAADPYLQVGINSVMNYCWGIDNSDSDTLKIAANSNANSATPSGGTILYALTSTGNASYVAGNLDVTRSAGGSTVQETISNTANSASSNALQQITVGGTSAGDPLTTYTVTGGSSWSAGVDNSDSDAYVISQSTALGTNNSLRIATNRTTSIVAGQTVAVTAPGAYPYTTLATDYMIIVDSSSARTINLMASPETGRTWRIKDNTGSAGTNNITITPAAGNIDGAASATINVNYGSADIVYNGTQFNVL